MLTIIGKTETMLHAKFGSILSVSPDKGQMKCTEIISFGV